ncbi:MAG: HEAT repeat domain-containing protein, partial [Vicinamibacterales bacterium]
PDDGAAVDRVLDSFSSAEPAERAVEELSDLSRTGASRLQERWAGLPEATRSRLVVSCREATERSVEHNFDRALLIALGDPEPEIRLAAIEGLAELESAAFCELLVARVEAEPDERVRAAEALALGRFALQCELGELDDDSASEVRDTLLRLIESDPSREVRRRALEAAGYLSGDEAVVDEIERAYDSGDHWLRVSAIHAMGRQADGRWLDIVHDELSSDEPDLRFEAVMALGSIGDERSVGALIDALGDDDVEVRLAAIGSLGAIGGHLAINTLRRLMEDDSPAIADAAEDALEDARLTANPLRPLL